MSDWSEDTGMGRPGPFEGALNNDGEFDLDLVARHLVAHGLGRQWAGSPEVQSFARSYLRYWSRTTPPHMNGHLADAFSHLYPERQRIRYTDDKVHCRNGVGQFFDQRI